MRHKARITVLKRMANPELAAEYRTPEVNERAPVPCRLFEDGQEFILTHWDGPPDGFCTWAWADIHKEIMLILSGGDHFGYESPGVVIACCTDAFKPVVFKIERIEAEP